MLGRRRQGIRMARRPAARAQTEDADQVLTELGMEPRPPSRTEPATGPAGGCQSSGLLKPWSAQRSPPTASNSAARGQVRHDGSGAAWYASEACFRTAHGRIPADVPAIVGHRSSPARTPGILVTPGRRTGDHRGVNRLTAPPRAHLRTGRAAPNGAPRTGPAHVPREGRPFDCRLGESGRAARRTSPPGRGVNIPHGGQHDDI